MKHSPIIRYHCDMFESDLDLMRIEYALAYLDRMNQPLYTHSKTFWLWWDNQWRLIDMELELMFQTMELDADRCRAIHSSRHRIDPLHRWPNEVAAERMMEEVYEHCLTLA